METKPTKTFDDDDDAKAKAQKPDDSAKMIAKVLKKSKSIAFLRNSYSKFPCQMFTVESIDKKIEDLKEEPQAPATRKPWYRRWFWE